MTRRSKPNPVGDRLTAAGRPRSEARNEAYFAQMALDWATKWPQTETVERARIALGDHIDELDVEMPTEISWTDETLNTVTGCTKVSPGCDMCYAATFAARNMAGHEGLAIRRPGEPADWTGELHYYPERLRTPLHWRRPRRVFIDSMSDLGHPDIPEEHLAKVLAMCGSAERHTFQLLTKRPQILAKKLADPAIEKQAKSKWWATWFMLLDSSERRDGKRADDPITHPAIDRSRARRLVWAENRTSMPLGFSDLPWPIPNLWVGTSIESDRYCFRADHLRATPAAVRFLSLEPLLGPLPSLDLTGMDWVIAGGESGPGARPMHPEWVRDIRDRCSEAGIPFHFKQWGAWHPQPIYSTHDDRYRVLQLDGTLRGTPWPGWGLDQPDGVVVERAGKKAAGRELDGRTWDEFPS